MKVTVDNDRRQIAMVFDSPLEFLKSLRPDQIQAMAMGLNEDPHWFGCPSFQEFISRINRGDDNLVAKYKNTKPTLKTPPKSMVKRVRRYGDSGTSFHMARYMEGIESFMSKAKQDVDNIANSKAKVVTVINNISENCHVNASEMFHRSLACLTAIRAYQTRNLPTRLSIVATGKDMIKDENYNFWSVITKVDIKVPSDPIVPSKLLQFATPYFFRAAMVRVFSNNPFYNSYDWAVHFDGKSKSFNTTCSVGSSVRTDFFSEKIKQFLGITKHSVIFEKGECLSEFAAKCKLKDLGIDTKK